MEEIAITALNIIIAILLFGLLILVHEFGHFFVARLCGVRVNEFAIGMGPRLLKWGRGETQYSLRAFPIGGFCAMEGEDEQSEDPRAFSSKPCWQRLLILCAGAFMNFLVGLIMLAIISSISKTYATSQIQSFYPGFESSAATLENGLMEGDQILKIDGERVYINNDISLLLGRSDDGVYDITVRRNGERVELKGLPLSVKDYEIDGQTYKLYGLSFQVEENSFLSVLKRTWLTAVDYVRLVRISLADLFTGAAGVDQLMGPVGIVDTMNTATASTADLLSKFLFLMNFGALIAVNLAVMNLLPLPALDGGRVLFTLIEMIFRKPVPAKYEAMVHFAGFVALMALMVFVCYNDIARIVGRFMT